MKNNTPLQYSTYPLTIGVKSDFTTPLFLELMDTGNSKEVLELLFIAKLKIVETSRKPFYKLLTMNNRGGKK